MLPRVLYIRLIVPSHMWSTSDDRPSISLTDRRSPRLIVDLLEWSSIFLTDRRSPWPIVNLLEWSSISLFVDHSLGPWSLPICRSSSRPWTPYVFPILVSCLDLGNLIFDPVAVIFDRGIAIFTLGIAIFGLGIAQLSSQSILLTELSPFEITPPNDRLRLLRSALPQACSYT